MGEICEGWSNKQNFLSNTIIMRNWYPIGTPVTIWWVEHIISAVAFYSNHEKYLCYRVEDWTVKEDWFSDFYFDVWKTNKKIGFEV